MSSPPQSPIKSESVPTLNAMAEKRIFEELCKSIKNETNQSVFAIGGIIPITSLPDKAICESDEVYSDGQSSDGEDIGERGGVPVAPQIGVMGVELGSFYGSGGEIDDTDADMVLNDPPTHKMRCDPVTLRWDSANDFGITQKLTLPCDESSRPAFEQLLRDCQPASFGRGGVDVMDESYRKAGKIDEKDFCSNFDPYAIGIVDAVAQVLMPDRGKVDNETRGLRAELYKLNVYSSPSGKFKAHVDTPRSKHQVGSLVVCLPSVHEGGQLVLRHEGREIVFDWSGEKGRNAIQWAAFYSDCEHEVLEVAAGHRMTLTYNLYATCRANAAHVDPKGMEVHKMLTELIKEPAFCKGGLILGYHCSHAYPHTEKDTIETLPTMLKGVDKLMHECFFATGLETSLSHVLSYSLSGVKEPCDLYKILKLDAEIKDESPWKALRDVCIDDGYRSDVLSVGREVRNEAGELVIISKNLVKLSLTETGMDEDCDDAEIIEAWTRDFRVERVRWLNMKSQEQMALVHGTYGNNAGLDTKYCSLVITLQIPPFQDR